MTINPNSFSFRVSPDPLPVQEEHWSATVLDTHQFRIIFPAGLPLMTLKQIMANDFPANGSGMICLLKMKGRHEVCTLREVGLIQIERSVSIGSDVYLMQLERWEDQPEVCVRDLTLITTRDRAEVISSELDDDPLTRAAVRSRLRGTVEPAIARWIAASQK